jgi:hypothetical protein
LQLACTSSVPVLGRDLRLRVAETLFRAETARVKCVWQRPTAPAGTAMLRAARLAFSLTDRAVGCGSKCDLSWFAAKLSGASADIGNTPMRKRPEPAAPVDREQTLLRRARRCARKGDDRKALVALREACLSAGTDARLWVLYGAACWRARKADEALRAMRQALWFRERNRDERRARVVKALIARIESGVSGELTAA